MTLKDYDLVETAEATVRGRVETVAVKVKNRVLGETSLKLADLRSLRSTAAVGNEFTVEAKYAKQNDQNWHDTGLDVTNDQPLEITADGTVDLAPQQPGQFLSGPAGNPNNGRAISETPKAGRSRPYRGAFTPDRSERGAVPGRHEPQGVPAVGERTPIPEDRP